MKADTSSDGKRLLHLRLDTDLVEVLDEEVERMGKEHPGLEVSRTAVLRMALREWAARRATPRKSAK